MSAARDLVVQALRTTREDQGILLHRMESTGGAVSLAQAEMERARAIIEAAEKGMREAMDALDAIGAEYSQSIREHVALTELLVEVELDSMGPTRAEERIAELRADAGVIPVELAEDDEPEGDDGEVLPFCGGGTMTVGASAPDRLEYDDMEYALAVDADDLAVVVCRSDEAYDPQELRQWIPGGIVVERRVMCTPWKRAELDEVTE